MFYCNGVIVMACVAGITITALQKIYAYTEKVVTFFSNHPSIILRSSFVHPSIGDWRMIIGALENH